MTRRLPRALVLLALPLALAIGACSEKLSVGDTCPVLCPGQGMVVTDTVIDPAIVLDTSLAPFPLQGFEAPILMASRGDTLDVRPIIRFDTLTRKFTPTGDTLQNVNYVDSAMITIRLLRTSYKVPQHFSIDVYDVGDTSLVDSIPSQLIPLFVPANVIGTVDIDSATFSDTAAVKIPLDTAKLKAIITSGRVLRVGLRLRSTEPGEFWMTSIEEGSASGPRLSYRVSTDTLVGKPSIPPSSTTPAGPGIAPGYRDYPLVVFGQDARAAGKFAVGGLPSVRTYLRFALPRYLLDSTAVLKATLELVQDPVRGLDESDSLTVHARLAIAGHATTDLNRAARLLAPSGYFVRDSLRTAPGDSGLVSLEINGVFRAWRRGAGVPDIPTAIVLVSGREGYAAQSVRFFGRTAAPALRPRIRVSYVKDINFGRP